MNNPDCLENLSRSKVATLCAGSVYPLTGGNDSSKDYWLYKNNGDLIDDGRDSVWSESGINLFNMEGLTREQQIAKMTGNWDNETNSIINEDLAKQMCSQFDTSGNQKLFSGNDFNDPNTPSNYLLRRNLSLYEILKPVITSQKSFDNALVNSYLYPSSVTNRAQNYLFLDDEYLHDNRGDESLDMNAEREFYQVESVASKDFGEWLLHTTQNTLIDDSGNISNGLTEDAIDNDRIAYSDWLYRGNKDGLSFMQKMYNKNMNTGRNFVVGSVIPEAFSIVCAGSKSVTYDTRRIIGISKYQIEWNFLQTRSMFGDQWSTKHPIEAWQDDWYRNYQKKGSK